MREHLEFIGLSTKESSLYLAGVRHGPLPASRLAELAGLKRVNAYPLLERLIHRGLAERNVRGRQTVFSMKRPDVVRSLLVEQQKQAKRLLTGFERELKKIPRNNLQHNRTDIQVFKGLREITREIQLLAKRKTPIFWMGNLLALTTLIPEQELFRLFSAKRMKHQTTTKAITDPSIEKLPRFRETVGGYRDFRFLPIAYESILALWQDTVGIFTVSQSPELIFIRDSQTASLLLTVFNALWNALPK